MQERPLSDWLPLSLKEAEKRGWDAFDVILVSGDAYVDNPSFGTAVIGRIIEDEGFRIGIIAQPNWRDNLRYFKKLGTPKFFFGDNVIPFILCKNEMSRVMFSHIR